MRGKAEFKTMDLNTIEIKDSADSIETKGLIKSIRRLISSKKPEADELVEDISTAMDIVDVAKRDKEDKGFSELDLFIKK